VCANRISQGVALAAAALGMLVCMGAARGPLEKANEVAEAKKVEPVVIRMYNVQDLVLGRDFPYRSAVLPPTSLEATTGWVTYSEAGAGGFGDLFPAEAPEKAEELGRIATTLSPSVLADLIMRTVDPQSWKDDERVKIDRVGALLVVTQTLENQTKIAELLEQFRIARPMVAIEAKWVLLEDAQVPKLFGAAGAKRTVPPIVTEAAFAEAKAQVIYRGQITCFDRQTVHIASGRAQTLMLDLEPVVAEAAVGWDPTLNPLLWGALLELTPALSPDRKSVTMKVHSMITEGKEVTTRTIEASVGDKAVPPTKGEVDLPEFLMHTFRTTVQAPLDKGVLIGGMTSPEALDGKVLYLILEVSASQDQPAEQPPAKVGK